MDELRFIVADTETTGLSHPIGVCEIGWIEINKDLDVLSEFDSLVNPEVRITEGAEGVHGISQEMVENEPTLNELPFPKGSIVLLCHNVGYDRPLVAEHMNIVAQCDTLILARRMLPDSENHQLPTLQAYCGLPKTLAHRALGDCRTVLNLLEYLMEGSGWSLTQLINYSNIAEKLDVMPWGKWAGTPMREVPVGYIKWLKSLDDLDIDMQLTLKDFIY